MFVSFSFSIYAIMNNPREMETRSVQSAFANPIKINVNGGGGKVEQG